MEEVLGECGSFKLTDIGIWSAAGVVLQKVGNVAGAHEHRGGKTTGLPRGMESECKPIMMKESGLPAAADGRVKGGTGSYEWFQG